MVDNRFEAERQAGIAIEQTNSVINLRTGVERVSAKVYERLKISRSVV